MSDRRSFGTRILATTLAVAVAASCFPAAAKLGDGDGPGRFGEARRAPMMRLAEADCSAAAAEAAAQTGGQVLSVSSREQGGRTVCVVTVLVPGEDGGRPRKQTITMPQ